MSPKYKLVKPSRCTYWLIRLAQPSPEGWREKSTKETRRRDAERVAAQIVAGLADTDAPRLTWKAFRATYERDHLSTLSRPGVFKSSAAKFEALAHPVYLDAIDAAFMKRWRQKMLAAGMKPTTVATYIKHVRASLGWAEENGYLKVAPRVRAGSTTKMKGRAITGEEFERMLENVSKVTTAFLAKKKQRPTKKKRKPRPPGKPKRLIRDAAPWRRLLNGLWLTGLRLQESLDITWDDPAGIHPVRIDSARPLLCFPSPSHKNRKDQLIPLTPEAATFLRLTPKKKRVGRIFPVSRDGRPLTQADAVSRIVSAIGRMSGIVTSTDPQTGKQRNATAHDLRRSFAQRLVDRRLPSELLQALMRHEDIKTTRGHYAEAAAEQLAEDVWQALQ